MSLVNPYIFQLFPTKVTNEGSFDFLGNGGAVIFLNAVFFSPARKTGYFFNSLKARITFLRTK